MQRDMDLVRRILLNLEQETPETRRSMQLEIDGYDNTTVGHHVYLMEQAGLVRAFEATAFGEPPSAIPLELTWAGHDYLSAVRDDGVWKTVKTKAGPKLGSLTFDVVKELGVAIVRGSLGLA
jgi:hypothetical protein